MSADNADKNKEEILDYSDLGKDVSFNYMGKKYIIPTIPRSKSRELFKVARDHRIKMSELEKERPENAKDDITEVEIDTMTKFQNDYLSSVIPELTPEIIDLWPTSVINKVMDLINSVISGTLGEEKKD